MSLRKESIENFDDDTSLRMPVWKLKEDVGDNTKRIVGRCSVSIKVDGTGRISGPVACLGISGVGPLDSTTVQLVFSNMTSD